MMAPATPRTRFADVDGGMLKTVLKRLIANVGAIAFVSWAVAVRTVDWLGRLTVGETVEQLSLKLPIWAQWFLTTPWWVPSILATVLVGFVVWLNWPDAAAATSSGSSKNTVELINIRALAAESQSYELPPNPSSFLSDAIVVDGDGSKPPSYRARFARNGRDGAFYIEVSYYVGMYGSGWTQTWKKLMLNTRRFSVGEMIDFPLVRRISSAEGTRWFWGSPPQEATDEPPVGMLNERCSCRGRVTFLSTDDTEEHCYFVLTTGADKEYPRAMGEHMFAHMLEWEGLKPRPGDPETLLK